MKVPPRWKVEREAARVRRQLRDIRFRVTDPINRSTWDMRRMDRIRFTKGSADATRKIAIVLIYQPSGCPASLFRSLQTIRAAGHAILLVSNTPLRRVDRIQLISLCWHILERPNFGYDFGGYRDGLWYLETILNISGEIDSLLLCNDTIWFPVTQQNDLFGDLARLETPVRGLTDSFIFDLDGKLDFETQGKYHITSFFIWLDRPVLSDPDFWSWWRHYKMTSIKRNVVHEGEYGFSRHLVDLGYASEVLVSKSRLLEWVDSLDTQRQSQLLGSLSIIPGHGDRKFRSLGGTGDATTGNLPALALRDFIKYLLRTINTSDLLAFEGVHRLGFPFLKKTILKNRKAREKFLALQAKHGTPIYADILDEIKGLKH